MEKEGARVRFQWLGAKSHKRQCYTYNNYNHIVSISHAKQKTSRSLQRSTNYMPSIYNYNELERK